MGYVERTLVEGERVLATERLHWIIYVRPLIMIVIGLGVFLFGAATARSNPQNPTATGLILMGAFFFICLGTLGAVRAWIRRLTTEIAATTRRFVVKRGLIRRNVREIQAWQIESVIIDQSVLGRLLNYGAVVVAGTGAGIDPVKPVAAPLRLRKAIDAIAQAARPAARP